MKKIILVLIMANNLVSCQHYMPGFDYKNFNDTPVEKLAEAVQNDDIEEINNLLTNEKLDVNYQDKRYQNSLLGLALFNQKYETAEALLKLGADPNLVGGKNNSTPFIDLLRYSYPNETCNTDKVRLLLKHGVDVNYLWVDYANTNRIYTPVMIAAQNGCLETVKLLVENGADINKMTHDESFLPISLALVQDRVDVLEYLIIEKKAIIPNFILIRPANRNYQGEPESKITLTDLLIENDYSKNPSMQKSKENILAYLKKIGKK